MSTQELTSNLSELKSSMSEMKSSLSSHLVAAAAAAAASSQSANKFTSAGLLQGNNNYWEWKTEEMIEISFISSS